jgi:hypothetical protein
MLKSLILLTLVLNIAFAKDRFSETDKKRFLDDVKQEIAEHKVENKGRVDLQIIKPGLYAELEEYLSQEKFTREELIKIKQDYENLAKDSSITSDRAEEAFYNFINNKLDEINSKALPKVLEGAICNNWSCEEGFKCAPDPVQEAIGKLKKAGATCSESSECVSNECVEATPGSKNKICEDTFRCFRPLSLGENCMVNPVCGNGACLPYNSMTSGIGESFARGSVCKKNSDCASSFCSAGICKDNFICKDCVSNGEKPQRGQKCCEGLYKNENGMCVPDVPPSVIPQVRIPSVKKIFYALINTIISNAEAQDVVTTNTDAAATTTTKTTEEEEADRFINTGALNDNIDLKSEIKNNKKKYESFKAKSIEGSSVDMNLAKATMKFEKRSNFATCDIHFRDDFFNTLMSDGTFDYEVAMLGFDFVTTGDADADYWTVNGKQDSSIHSRLKKIGLAHKLIRKETNKKVDYYNKKLTCMCLDVQGYNKIENSDKKKFFAEQCDEYEKYTNPSTNYDELDGDASGVKAKRLLYAWTQNLTSFYMELTVDNSGTYNDMLAVSNWARSDAKWSTAKTENFNLFKFSIKGSGSKSVAALGGLVGALLAAGVIAILGGFATTSILSAWAAAGIITASAATGAGGLWMIASLKGAWITQRPEITDSHVAPRSYSCGKKQTCMEYTRTLVQPYNDVCGIHTSSNACIKSFVVVNENSESRYIVDPWVPAGVSKEAILKNQPVYADKMEEAFKTAKSAMISKNPKATGGGGKKGGGSFVSTSYLSEVFIDATLVGKYVPALGPNLESTYFMNPEKIKLIKDAARSFAISEGFLKPTETANLDAFANYAYEYHFLWPKKSNPGEISYPTVGLQTYLSYMAKEVSGKISTSTGKTAVGLSRLSRLHLTDLIATLELFADKPINQTDALKSSLLAKEIADAQKELENLVTMNGMLDNKNLDTQLSTLNSTFVADQSKLAGATGNANFSTEQTSFLKAIGNLRSSRKLQLKELDTYNKAMAANGDKERTAKMASVSKNFSAKFANKSGSIFSSSGLGSTNSSTSGNANTESDRTSGSSTGSSYGSSSGTGALFGGGARGSSGPSDGVASAKESATDAAVNEDEKRLADAIEARNQAKKDKYQSTDGQSLFEKVTNAYIRNYDKVLTKKKDKDVIEDKQ